MQSCCSHLFTWNTDWQDVHVCFKPMHIVLISYPCLMLKPYSDTSHPQLTSITYICITYIHLTRAHPFPALYILLIRAFAIQSCLTYNAQCLMSHIQMFDNSYLFCCRGNTSAENNEGWQPHHLELGARGAAKSYCQPHGIAGRKVRTHFICYIWLGTGFVIINIPLVPQPVALFVFCADCALALLDLPLLKRL